MSAPNKLRGGTGSELTKLKALWRDSLSDSARDFWRALFISDTKQADIRAQIFAKLKIKLTADKQLNAFRNWLDYQDVCDQEAELMEADERRLTAQFGDALNKDQIREQVLKASYARTLATGNFKLGLATVKQDVIADSAEEEKRRYLDAKRSDEEKALALVLEQSKAYPDVQEKFKAAFAALKQAKGK